MGFSDLNISSVSGVQLRFGSNGAKGISVGLLRDVVETLGACETRFDGSHRRFVSANGKPFGIPGKDTATVSPGIFEEVVRAMEETKGELIKLCHNTKALKN